ncbi:hypothetical protein IFM89_021042, partial [Coptis chinensis]
GKGPRVICTTRKSVNMEDVILSDKGIPDDTYTADGVALIRISGTYLHDNKTIEVDPPEVAVKLAKEGTENSSFWFALGRKQRYTSKKGAQEIIRDAHLYTFSFNKGTGWKEAS